MTDTTRDPLLDTESVVPVTTGATGEPEAPLGAPAKGEKARSLGSDAWDELRHRPMFWISGVLIVVFVLMAAFPQLFTSTDPYTADLSKAREAPSADAWFGRDGQGYDVYARTIYGARASIMVGILATLFVAVFGSFVGIVAGYRAGWVDSVLSRIGEIFLGIPLLLGGILFLYVFPSDPLTTPFLVQVAKVALVLGAPRLAGDHAADALQRAAGQAERLRAGGPRARRHTAPDHQLPHPAQLAGLGDRGVHHQPRRLHLGRGEPVLPGHRVCSRRPSPGASRSPRPPGIGLIRAAPHMLLFPSLFLSADGARVHHARRRGPRRPRPEAALRRRHGHDIRRRSRR